MLGRPVFADFWCCETVCPRESPLYCLNEFDVLWITVSSCTSEVRAVLLFAPNVTMVVVDATQSSMSSDSVTSDCVGLAGNTLSSDFNMLVGLWETASEALCHFPGQCWIVNLYLSVFSFSLNWILLRTLFPNSPFRGSWSVTTMRLGQPMMNIWHFSNAHAITAASPSIGAYLLSTSIQNLLPANIRCHPSGQQMGALSVAHEQCFCNRRKPIPSLLQSGARQVMRFFSKVAMPFRTRSTMTCLEYWNAASRPWSQAMSILFNKIMEGEHDWAKWVCPGNLIDQSEPWSCVS